MNSNPRSTPFYPGMGASPNKAVNASPPATPVRKFSVLRKGMTYEEIEAETSQILENGALVFMTNGRLVKGISHGSWATIEEAE